MTKTATLAKTVRLATWTFAAILSTLSACGDLRRNTIPVEGASFTPDGLLVLFMAAGLRVYDQQLEAEVARIPLDAVALPATRNGAIRYSLSADGATVAVAYANRIALYRIPDGSLLNVVQLTGVSAMGQVALSPNGKLVCAIVSTAGSLTTTVVDTATGTPLWAGETPWSLPVWSADGATLFVKREERVPDSAIQALDARTGGVKWTTEVKNANVLGLALVGGGALLAGAAELQGVAGDSCPEALGCPAILPFWSVSDGTLTTQLATAPRTHLYGVFAVGGAGFACNATDTCAAGLRDYSRVDLPQPKYAHIYRPDGTVLMTVPSQGASPLAISSDGQFLAMVAEPGDRGGATVFRVADGTVAAVKVFPVDTF